MTSLYDNIIFGPVRSRRLGLSLGVNLLPVDSKLCNFDCLYCECGWNEDHPVAAVSTAERMCERCSLRLCGGWSMRARCPM